MRNDKNSKLKPSGLQNIKGIGGHNLTIKGQLEVEIDMMGLKITHSFQVVNDFNLPVVLGVDFLTSHAAQIDFGSKTLTLYHGMTKIPLFRGAATEGLPVQLMAGITIPARTETMVPVHIPVERTVTGVIEPANLDLAGNGVFAARTLVTTYRGQTICTIRNPSPVEVTLNQSCTIGYLCLLEQVFENNAPRVCKVAVSNKSSDMEEARRIVKELGVTLENSDLSGAKR
jgi:hypothetical protein